MKTKRILSALLAALLLTGALTACATEGEEGGTEPAATTASAESETVLTDNLPDDLDYGGDEIVFISRV